MTAPGSYLLSAYITRGLAYETKGDIDSAKADYTAALGVTVTDANSKAGQAAAKAKLAAFNKADALPPRPATNSAGGRRVALVIGNGAYAHVTALPNPPNDAHAVAKTLRDLGFEVTESIDADHATLEKVTSNFIVDATGAKIALLYYAGHGVQIDGHNFLVPVDIQRDSVPNLMAAMTDMDNLLAGLDDKIRTNILIFDACRNNPFEKVADAGTGRSISISTGLASPGSLASGATAGAGTLIAFATAPGKVALDGEGGNSPFSAALSKYMPTPGIEVQQMLTRVRADVVASTGSKQVPWSNSSLLGEVLSGRGEVARLTFTSPGRGRSTAKQSGGGLPGQTSHIGARRPSPGSLRDPTSPFQGEVRRTQHLQFLPTPFSTSSFSRLAKAAGSSGISPSRICACSNSNSDRLLAAASSFAACAAGIAATSG